MKTLIIKKTLIKNFHKGFTLAEVLITLLIIGVVASLVIPNIIADTQEQELKTAWKKAYATVSNATKLQMAEEGSVTVSTIKNYMTVTKKCSTSPTLPACVMTCPSGWGCNDKPTSTEIFITADGMQWGDFGSDQWCAVDVNGTKGPNQANKDVFAFCIFTDGRVVPAGHPDCMFGFSPNALNWLSQ